MFFFVVVGEYRGIIVVGFVSFCGMVICRKLWEKIIIGIMFG